MGRVDIAFLVAVCLGLSTMASAVTLGRRLGLVVKPRLFGRSETPITHLGGPALALAALGTYLMFQTPDRKLWVILGGGLAVLVLGFFDDLLSARNGIHPLGRLVVEALIAAVMWTEGIQAISSAPRWVDATVTILFLVGSMNALNLLDNMDGVAGMSTMAAAFGVVIVALVSRQNALAAFGACIGGATAAFLFFNLVRPKVYLGDAGSLFLGLILGGTALQLEGGFAPPENFMIAVVLMGVAFTDTASRQLSRWLSGGSPFDILGGTDHLSHRMVRLGFTSVEAAQMHAAGGLLGAACAGFAVVSNSRTPLIGALLLFSCSGLGFVAISRGWMISKPAYPPAHAAEVPELV